MVVNALRDVVYVWLTTSQASFVHPAFFSGSYVLFMGPASNFFFFFQKNNFKIRPYGTIYIFKNYFATVFLVFSNKWYPIRPVNTCCN